jgi:hypothetical protein
MFLRRFFDITPATKNSLKGENMGERSSRKLIIGNCKVNNFERGAI